MIVRKPNSIARRSGQRRSGAALAEAAISIGVLMTFLVFLLDYSVASYRSEALNYLADRVARTASVQGPKALSSLNGGPWGPTTVTTSLSGSNRIAVIAQNYNLGLPASQVTLTVSWPETGGNAIGNSVVVTAEMPWSPSILRPLTQSVLTLRGVSRQTITH